MFNIVNGNAESAVNNFGNLPLVPYRIIETLASEDTEEAEMFWKLLCYSQPDCMEKDNLTEDEKTDTVYLGESLENDYHIFMKPLIGAALDSAQSQTQMRIYRNVTDPTSSIEALANFTIIFTTNEKESTVRYKGMAFERTDLLETLFLNIMNKRDLGVGVGYLEYDDKASRACGSTLGINNSKSFYGRTLVMALKFVGADSDDRYCG